MKLTGAERLVGALELLARDEFLALGVDALVEVDKVLLRGVSVGLSLAYFGEGESERG